MKKLLTIPYGSRLYGTFTETSDHDWKYIVLPPLEDLLIGIQIKNKFYSTGSDRVKNTSDDTDTEIIALQTLAKDVLEGQTYALEVCYGALQHEVIEGCVVHDDRILSFIKELLIRFLTSNINAMVGYAYNQAQIYSAKGDRLEKLHAFRDLLEYAVSMDEATEVRQITPEVKLGRIMDTPVLYRDLVDKTFYLTETKNPDNTSQRCFSLLEKMYPEGITIAEAMQRVETNIKKYGKRANQARENEGTDWKALSHAVRIVDEAHRVLTEQWINLPYDKETVQRLLAIKHGQVERDVIQQHLITRIDELKELQEKSTLPANNAALYAEFQDWLRIKMLQFYEITR